jgi:hypothetical protein
MVKKYLKPEMEGMDKGPQMSICIKSKLLRETLVLKGKDNLFCFA